MCQHHFKARASWGECELASGRFSGMSDRLPGYVAEARNNISMALAVLQNAAMWPKVSPYYEKYFLSGLAQDDALHEVMERLVLTNNGLEGDIRIKVVKKVAVSGMNTGEAVAKVENLSYAQGPVKKELGHNLVKELLSGQQTRYGDVVLEQELVDLTGNAGASGYDPVKTIIHEATHKFAGSVDYWYFDQKTGEVAGGSFGAHTGGARKFGDEAHGLKADVLARMNADSFGWFCRKVGSRTNRFYTEWGGEDDRNVQGIRGPGGLIG